MEKDGPVIVAVLPAQVCSNILVRDFKNFMVLLYPPQREDSGIRDEPDEVCCIYPLCDVSGV